MGVCAGAGGAEAVIPSCCSPAGPRQRPAVRSRRAREDRGVPQEEPAQPQTDPVVEVPGLPVRLVRRGQDGAALPRDALTARCFAPNVWVGVSGIAFFFMLRVKRGGHHLPS